MMSVGKVDPALQSADLRLKMLRRFLSDAGSQVILSLQRPIPVGWPRESNVVFLRYSRAGSDELCERYSVVHQGLEYDLVASGESGPFIAAFEDTLRFPDFVGQ
jgi:hypothetical protein